MKKMFQIGLLISIACTQGTLIKATFVENKTSDPKQSYEVSLIFNAPTDEDMQKRAPDGRTWYDRTKTFVLPRPLNSGERYILEDIVNQPGDDIFDHWKIIELKRLPFRVIFNPLDKSQKGIERVIDIDDAKVHTFTKCNIFKTVYKDERMFDQCVISNSDFGIILTNENDILKDKVGWFPAAE